MRTTVRATRSYMAGVGTSGSLLAGAALLFILGSAIVAFRGWPQIATGPATTSLSAGAQPTAPSHTARRLTVLLRRRTAIIGGTALRRAGAGRRAPVRAVRGITVKTGSTGSAPRGGNTPATGPAPATSSTGTGTAACGGSSCTSPQSMVSHLTNTVSQQVTRIGSEVGSQVATTSATVAGAVSGVSPQAGNVLQSAGSTAGGAVSGTATTVGNAVSQAGNTLGGGH